MSRPHHVSRRQFIEAGTVGAGLVAAGGIGGWWAMRNRREETGQALWDTEWDYEVGDPGPTDPELILYAEAQSIPTSFTQSTCMAEGNPGQLLVGGDRRLLVMRVDGEIEKDIAMPDTPRDAVALPGSRLAVAFRKRVVILDQNGAIVTQMEKQQGRAFFTALAVSEQKLLIADAGKREIVVCDLEAVELRRFGRRDDASHAPGFVIPSPYFDICVGPDGLLNAANTGRHQIEQYGIGGEYLSGWGSASMAIDDFCGCCNPTHFTMLADGRYVTSEKGINRIKIYRNDGSFEGVVAGPELLVRDKELAKRACTDCNVGFSFGVACAADQRVFALDPVSREVRVFEPRT